MQIIETTNEGLKKGLKIILPGNKLAEQVNTRLEELCKTIRLPGFRPGKVPLKVVKMRYEDAVYGEVVDKSIQESCEKALVEKEYKPASQPKVDIIKFEKGEDLELSLEVEVLPEIPDVDLKKFKIEKPVAKVSTEQVESSLKQLAEQHASSHKTEIKKKRALKKGDIANFDFTGRINGEEFAGGAAEGFELEIGSGQFIPGFEDQMVGLKIGEEKDLTVKFPENYGAKDLAGQDAVFTVKIHKIFEKTAPKIDDDFAKSLGLDNLKALKDSIESRIQKESENLSFAKVKRQVLDNLADTVEIDMPPSMIEQEFEQIWKQIEEDKKAGRLDEEDSKKSDKQLKEDYTEIAVRRIKLGLVLADIGSKQKIQVTNDEVNNWIAAEANKYPEQREMVYKIYQENPQLLQNIRGPIFEDKVVQYILDNADVKEKKVSMEDLLAPEEPAAKPKKKAAKKAAPKKEAKTSEKKATEKDTKKKATSTAAKKKTVAAKDDKKKTTAKPKTAAKKTTTKKKADTKK